MSGSKKIDPIVERFGACVRDLEPLLPGLRGAVLVYARAVGDNDEQLMVGMCGLHKHDVPEEASLMLLRAAIAAKEQSEEDDDEEKTETLQ